MKRKGISKLIAIVVCAIMLTTLAIPLAEVNAVSENWTLQVKTDGGNLNVRSGPGTNYSIIGQFANGTYVTFGFVDPIPSADWTHVSGIGTKGETLIGYCNNAYLVDDD